MSRIELDLKRMKIIDYYEFNTLMTELLGNAIEHGIQERNINWWMYHFRDYRTDTMHIVLLIWVLALLTHIREPDYPSNILIYLMKK